MFLEARPIGPTAGGGDRTGGGLYHASMGLPDLFRRRARGPRDPLALVLYTRAGCHLCEVMKAEIESALARETYDLEEVDIDGDPALVARFGESIPVLAIEGRVAFKLRLTAAELSRKVERAFAERRS